MRKLHKVLNFIAKIVLGIPAVVLGLFFVLLLSVTGLWNGVGVIRTVNILADELSDALSAAHGRILAQSRK